MSLAALGATDIGIKTFDRPHEPGETGETPVIAPAPVHHVQCQPLDDDSLLHEVSVHVYASGPNMGEPSVGTRNRAWGRQQMCDTSLVNVLNCVSPVSWPGLLM